ncbi:hypothetical protein L1887_42135 [Cichorium endivia]|nr:hypothetical protein L1887_42135 [Cichorium endivia]
MEASISATFFSPAEACSVPWMRHHQRWPMQACVDNAKCREQCGLHLAFVDTWCLSSRKDGRLGFWSVMGLVLARSRSGSLLQATIARAWSKRNNRRKLGYPFHQSGRRSSDALNKFLVSRSAAAAQSRLAASYALRRLLRFCTSGVGQACSGMAETCAHPPPATALATASSRGADQATQSSVRDAAQAKRPLGPKSQRPAFCCLCLSTKIRLANLNVGEKPTPRPNTVLLLDSIHAPFEVPAKTLFRQGC